MCYLVDSFDGFPDVEQFLDTVTFVGSVTPGGHLTEQMCSIGYGDILTMFPWFPPCPSKILPGAMSCGAQSPFAKVTWFPSDLLQFP